ncbi:zinc-dependent peptidase [Lacinutrix iliipiscaria]|uniref:Zinc-dependent peptidase n=1 Tax=Lacinutrix iliipiscaria TaxID=1230532 RepID=A0ABW5WL53_9FLAO
MNHVLLSFIEEQDPPLIFKVVLAILIAATLFLFLFVLTRGIFNFLEMAYVEFFKKKLFFNHVYVKRKKLPEDYRLILRQEFSFYNRLTDLEKKNFEHRLNHYLKSWEFIGKEIVVTNTMKILISATAAKLTFGLRDYKIRSIDKIIIYPDEYYSTINKVMHKGEFNMAYNALIFSWEDFKIGYDVHNDNLNLGVHECIHAMHFTFLKSRRHSTSAAVFLESFQELTVLIDENISLKQKLINSDYIRDYAFENQFEFISVLVENFIETPVEFRSHFPKIYSKVKQMLNFNFAGY